MFNQKNSHAAKITGMLMLALSLIFYIVLREKEPIPQPVVTATPKPTVTTTLPPRTPTPTATLTPVPLPSPTETLTPKPDSRTKAKAKYPEHVTRVDQALKTLVVELQSPVRNASDTGWLFPWRLIHFTPPVLDGVKGGNEVMTNKLFLEDCGMYCWVKPGYKSNRSPYQIILSFNIHPIGSDASQGIHKFGITNGQVEILDSQLPDGEYEFSVQGLYHSHAYSQATNWMPWQKLQVH